jgi:hypothetical protein
MISEKGMFTPDRNPFEVLRLDPTASEDEIVRRAGQLRRRTGDPAALAELLRAVQSLTRRPEDRELLALFTHPVPEYSTPALERVAAAFRRPPAPSEVVQACTPLDIAEFAGCIAAKLAEELDTPPPPFEPVAPGDDADEIRRQSDEALWQGMIFDTRA